VRTQSHRSSGLRAKDSGVAGPDGVTAFDPSRSDVRTVTRDAPSRVPGSCRDGCAALAELLPEPGTAVGGAWGSRRKLLGRSQFYLT